MKGLNVPQINRNSPLDIAFEEVEEFLKLDEANPDSALDQLYKKVSNSGDGDAIVDNDLNKLRRVGEKAFDLLDTIQYHSLKISERTKLSGDAEKAHLISISLHDMKHFNDLITLIIVQLIYPLLPNGIGIPLEQRRLKSFVKRPKLFKYTKIHSGLNVLVLIVDRFYTIFTKGGDVKDLLIKGSGLTDVLTILIVLIHELEDTTYTEKYNFFENISDTYNLYGIYTVLLQSSRVPKYQTFISNRLHNLTVNRSNGVLSLADFIVGLRDEEDVNIEKFDHFNRVLLSKPKTISVVEYFTKIFDQIYEILVFVNRPILLSVVVNFIRVLYAKNKRIVHDFLFKKIWKFLDPITDGYKPGETIVKEKELNDSINVLISLTKENSEEFLNELFSRIIINLWSFYFYLSKKKLEYKSILSNILVSFFTVTSNNDFLKEIISNLINSHGDDWIFQTTLENKLTSIVKVPALRGEITNEEIFEDIDTGLNCVIDLFKNLSDELVKAQFLIVLNRWILSQDKDSSSKIGEQEENPFFMLIDLKFLEKVNENFKDALLDKPEDVLLVIKNLLQARFLHEHEVTEKEEEGEKDVDSDDEDDEEQTKDNLNILLELLSAILTETNPIELFKYKETLTEMSTILSDFTNNLQCSALRSRIKEFLDNDGHEVEASVDLQDKQLLEKAIVNMNDPLIPIRAHGLYLLRQLIKKRSPVITLDFVLDLHIIQLHDEEPFIYLNVIKSLNELCDFDQDGTLNFLVNFYQNSKEKIDDRLKIGEVLINYIMKSNELLTGPLVDEMISKTLRLVQDFDQDDRIRMSAMSLIGQSLRTNAIGISKFIKDALDCSIGILEFESDITMKRSAVVLIGDLIAFGGLSIVPRGYGDKLKTLLKYVKINSNDLLLIEQIDKVLEIIDDLIKDKFRSINSLPSNLKSLQIKDLK